ncbi:MAG: hypothetical protein ABI672_14895 [Vicinamibacteria bacterium]
MTRWRGWLLTLVTLFSAAPQCFDYARHIVRSDFQGSTYGPRVDATLQASTATLQGGPFATVPAKGGFSVAAGLINDLGIASIVSGWTRITGDQATSTTLGWINFWVLLTTCVLLVFAFPLKLRAFLIPVFLFVPMIVPTYDSVDSVAIHGVMAAFAVAVAMITLRAPHLAIFMLLGVATFVIHKIRLVYPVYAAMVLFAGAFIVWLAFRATRPMKAAALLLLGFAICEVPWRIAVSQRLSDPRIIERDALPEHATYEALISGIGWTANPWGLKPEDPWVAQFLADTFRGPVVHIASVEGERRARAFYLGLVRRQPGALARLYVGRIPMALSEYSLLGTLGAVAWVGLGTLALVLSLRRRDLEGFVTVLAPVGLAATLILQIIVIDNRYIYSYPLGVVSALVLAAAVPVILRNIRKESLQP